MAKARTTTSRRRNTTKTTATAPAVPKAVAKPFSGKAPAPKVVDMTTPKAPETAPVKDKYAAQKRSAARPAHYRLMGNINKRIGALTGGLTRAQGWLAQTPADDTDNRNRLTLAIDRMEVAIDALNKAADALQNIPADFNPRPQRKASIGVGSIVRFKADFADDYLEYFIDDPEDTFEIVRQLKGHKKFLAKNSDGNVCRVVRGQIELPESDTNDD